VSAASFQQFVPLAPGAIVSIYGDYLSSDTAAYSTTPLPVALADTNVFMAGRVLPLYYVSPSQVNVQVPYDINVNTSQQIYVRKGITASQPISVDVAPAQPAIFAVVPQQSSAGGSIVLYASGLGAVDPALTAGVAAGSGVLSYTVSLVQVTVGDKPATVLFAGLAPGFVGLYQVNVIVPDGVGVGSDMPVAISVGGQTSPPAVLAVQ
jgi:uncharacterized protein (TIGR03437 family)